MSNTEGSSINGINNMVVVPEHYDGPTPEWSILNGMDTLDSVPGPVLPNNVPYFWRPLITESECDIIARSVQQNREHRRPHMVYTADGSGSEVNTECRHTYYYENTVVPGFEALERRINGAADYVARTYFRSTATPIYAPQILEYEAGCHFRSHCDNSLWNAETNSWVRNDHERDLSCLLYLSDQIDDQLEPGFNQFTGGSLVLDSITTDGVNPVSIRPQRGIFVAFPSHPLYRHTVPPIIAGYRLAIVNWWRMTSIVAVSE